MPATVTMLGALLGLGIQMYSNAFRKLPYMRHPWEHVFGMGLGAVFVNHLVKWDDKLKEDLDKMLDKAKAANERRYFGHLVLKKMKMLYLVFAAMAILSLWLPATASLPAIFTVERSFPVQGVDINKLKARDFAFDKAHSRRLFSDGIIVQPLDTFGIDLNMIPRLYFTRVKIGNPPKEFYVEIDTDIDILWVTCIPCDSCTFNSVYNHSESWSASLINCSNPLCISSIQTGKGQCGSSGFSSQCSYTFTNVDGTGSSGYYVSDTMQFDMVNKSGQSTNYSTDILFGCSSNPPINLTSVNTEVDGIFGFGQNKLSVISQLSAAGASPRVFSHCLKGSGGGTWVLGEMVEPGIVYTPLVPSQRHYYLNLQNIAVNGKQLNINPSVFFTSSTQGTIIDTGTIFAYLPEEAYNTLVNGILSAIVSPEIKPLPIEWGVSLCFNTTSDVDAFPTITLNFADNASMNIKPEEYLLPQLLNEYYSIWCLGWMKNQGGMTILGDLVLRDKIFVYDLAKQRIGWVDYNCSQFINVSDYTNLNGGLSWQSSLGLLPIGITILLVYIFAFPIN